MSSKFKSSIASVDEPAAFESRQNLAPSSKRRAPQTEERSPVLQGAHKAQPVCDRSRHRKFSRLSQLRLHKNCTYKAAPAAIPLTDKSDVVQLDRSQRAASV